MYILKLWRQAGFHKDTIRAGGGSEVWFPAVLPYFVSPTSETKIPTMGKDLLNRKWQELSFPVLHNGTPPSSCGAQETALLNAGCSASNNAICYFCPTFLSIQFLLIKASFAEYQTRALITLHWLWLHVCTPRQIWRQKQNGGRWVFENSAPESFLSLVKSASQDLLRAFDMWEDKIIFPCVGWT